MLDKTLLLNTEQISMKIERLANELAEYYYQEKEIYVFGISGQGYNLAKNLVKEVQKNSKINITLSDIKINKHNPQETEIFIDKQVLKLSKNKNILIVDDVLNSGKTLFYAMRPFINMSVKSIKVLVLVNRSHHLFPVHPDFVGLNLSTTYENHVETILDTKKNTNVFLLNK